MPGAQHDLVQLEVVPETGTQYQKREGTLTANLSAMTRWSGCPLLFHRSRRAPGFVF